VILHEEQLELRILFRHKEFSIYCTVFVIIISTVFVIIIISTMFVIIISTMFVIIISTVFVIIISVVSVIIISTMFVISFEINASLHDQNNYVRSSAFSRSLSSSPLNIGCTVLRLPSPYF